LAISRHWGPQYSLANHPIKEGLSASIVACPARFERATNGLKENCSI
jgi:hypothetical protein